LTPNLTGGTHLHALSWQRKIGLLTWTKGPLVIPIKNKKYKRKKVKMKKIKDNRLVVSSSWPAIAL
jgi:hypothetical protein